MNVRQVRRTASLPGRTSSLRVAGGRGALLVVLAAGVLTGCGGSSGSAGGGAASSSANPDLGKVIVDADGVQEVMLQTQDDYAFTPNAFTVAPGKVRLTVTSVATQLSHNFRFTPDKGPEPIPAEIPLLAPGASSAIEFTVTTPGDYPFECSFHVQLGQTGTMTVSGR